MGFPGGNSSKEPCQCRREKRYSFNPWVGEYPREEDMATQRKKKKEISNIFKKVLIQTLIEIQMIINFYLGL